METITTVKISADEVKKLICEHLRLDKNTTKIELEIPQKQKQEFPFSLSEQMADKNVPQQNER